MYMYIHIYNVYTYIHTDITYMHTYICAHTHTYIHTMYITRTSETC